MQAIVVVLVGIALRLLEWPHWQAEPAAWWRGEPILPSHDAFAWVAGATGTGRMHEWPLSRLIAAAADVLAISPATVAFWLPLVLAPTAGLVMLVYAHRARLGWAGLPAALATVSGIGYLARTRLGFADTDLFSLPLLVAAAGAAALAFAPPRMRAGGLPPVRGLGAALATAWLLAALCAVYPSGYPIATAIVAAGAIASMLTCAANRRSETAALLLVIAPAAHFGVVGPLISTLLAALFLYRGSPKQGALLFGTAALAVLIWALPPEGAAAFATLGEYLRHGDVSMNAGAWTLPNPAGSIGETGELAPADRLPLIGQHALLLALGLVAFVVAVLARPAILPFAPLLLLGLGSLVLGTRFAMFAAPTLGLGVGVVWQLVAARRGFGVFGSVCGQVVMGLAFVAAAVPVATEFRPRPILPPAHLDLLDKLGRRAPESARVWTWWDIGYATQYYAQRPTLADGGTASSRRLLMLSRALAADEPGRTAATIALASAPAGDNPNPMSTLDGLDAAAAQDRLDTAQPLARGPGTPQYLVVDWHTIMRAEWVTLFGNWRLTAGAQDRGESERIRPPVELDADTGLLATPDGRVALRSLDVLDRNGVQRFRWPNPDGPHAIVNNGLGQGVLVDSPIYRSSLVQMLIAAPADFAPLFELVVDEFPVARVYRVSPLSAHRARRKRRLSPWAATDPPKRPGRPRSRRPASPSEPGARRRPRRHPRLPGR